MNGACSSLLLINEKSFHFVLYPHFDLIKSIRWITLGVDFAVSL